MRAYYKKVSQKAQKLDKEQLLKLIDGIVDENENLYSIFDSISAGILIVDNEFILKQSNTIAESRLSFNRPLDESRNNRLKLWELIDDNEIADFFKRCYLKNITNCNEDFSITTEGGSVRFITITMTPLVEDGNINNNGRIILIRDVTDKKNQDILLHRMENMAGLTNLAAGMAHDIKNPLGAISIHIQLIQKALAKARENENILPDKKFVEDHIDVVNEEIEFLNRLVMDFLFAVRPINATLELKSPAAIVDNLCKFITPEFNENNFEVQCEDMSNNSKIMIDEKLFRDVMMNLATNALAAMQTQKKNCDESYKGLFKVTGYTRDNKYILKISDNGCGMSPETVAKIFEQYFTTKANGTGLGMTTVYKIIKEFSGEIQVASTPGEGTCFTLKFPLQMGHKLAINN